MQSNTLAIQEYAQNNNYSNAAFTIPSPPYPEANNHFATPTEPPAYHNDGEKLVKS